MLFKNRPTDSLAKRIVTMRANRVLRAQPLDFSGLSFDEAEDLLSMLCEKDLMYATLSSNEQKKYRLHYPMKLAHENNVIAMIPDKHLLVTSNKTIELRIGRTPGLFASREEFSKSQDTILEKTFRFEE